LALCGAIAELKGFAAGIDPFKLIGRWAIAAGWFAGHGKTAEKTPSCAQRSTRQQR
jgi:hypothetical protein